MFFEQDPALEIPQSPELDITLSVLLEDGLNAGHQLRLVLLDPVVDALLEDPIILVALDDGFHSVV